MKIVGLITEYNPFHNGHLYHIKESLRVTGADAAVVVMSGDYVQRGTPAIMPKRIRAEMALMCGAGAVFELPVCYATGSAELFFALWIRISFWSLLELLILSVLAVNVMISQSWNSLQNYFLKNLKPTRFC